jgi:uncharacterized protein YcfJ
MLKRIVVIGVLAALTGCATHQQANTAVGAGVGAVIGNAVGGRGSAVAGAVLGTAIGSQQPVHTHSAPAVIYGPSQSSAYSCYIDGHTRDARRNTCWRVHPYDALAREYCYRDADQKSTVCHQVR